MKFKNITKRNWTPIDFLSRTSKKDLSQPAFAVDLNKVGDDVARIYSNFKSAEGSCTAGTGATAGFSISDTEVDSDTKIVMTISEVSASSGYPVLASAVPGDETIDVVVTNYDSNTPLEGAIIGVDYFINKELS